MTMESVIAPVLSRYWREHEEIDDSPRRRWCTRASRHGSERASFILALSVPLSPALELPGSFFHCGLSP
jgi:hypothetical protein